MQADNEDRYVNEAKSGGLPVIPLVVALLILLAAGYWYFSPEKQADAPPPPVDVAPVVPALPVAPPEPAPEPVPDIPEPEPVAPPEPNEPPPPPPLTLDESDPVVRETLTPAIDNTTLAPALQANNLIERTAALVDLTRQGRVEPKLFPLPRPEGKFAVTPDGENLYMDPAGFSRYDGHAQAISALDPQLLAGAFHQFRPLLEQAWKALGYKEENLDNNLIRALDEVIEAPVLEHPPILVKDVTTYNYADESLEELSPLAKQLIRMGPENQALVQAQARAIREALLASPQQ
jgi:DUF3014 family protein